MVGVLGKTVQIDTSLSAVLSDLLNTTVTLPSESGVSSSGTVPAAVAGILQQAQTDYTNALAALKANNLGQFQTDITEMQQAITQAQDVIGSTTPGATTTTTTTAPPAKGGKASKKTTTPTTTHASTSASSSTTTSLPTSTEPKNTTTTSSTLVSAAPKT